MLGGDGAGSPGDKGSDRGAQGNVSFFLVYVKNLSLTLYRNAGKVIKRPSPKHKPSDHDTPQKKGWDAGGDVVIPYDVGTRPPVPTPPLPKTGGNEVCCDSPLFRRNAILTPSEKERGRKDFGRENRGKETEQAIKMGKDGEAMKPAESTTKAPARTKFIHDSPPAILETLPDTRNNNDVAGTSGSVDNPNKPPLSIPSPGLDLDENTTPSMFLRGFARCQEINQTSCCDSSAS